VNRDEHLAQAERLYALAEEAAERGVSRDMALIHSAIIQTTLTRAVYHATMAAAKK
jgi:hypothetical protein